MCQNNSSSPPQSGNTSTDKANGDKRMEVDVVFKKEMNERGFESLSRSVQFGVLVMGVFVFFGTHNVLQEAMMKLPGFNYGVMLGYMEVVGVSVCSFFERKYVFKETGRVAPLSAYPLLTFCLLSSSALSNMALDYINFPTKVVFRSCKLIPTMMVASILNKKKFTSSQYLCAVAVCAGLVFFAAADFRLTPSFEPLGIILVTLSVCADAFLPNAQERLFNLGSSRLEVTFYTNIFTLIAMTCTTYLSGDLVGIIRHAMRDRQLALYMLVYTSVAYIAISCHMNVVKRFGGVVAVCVATARKGMTLVLSFVLFPKAFSWYYVWGGLLVLGGLMISSLMKIREKQNQISQTGEIKRQNSDTGFLPLDSKILAEDTTAVEKIPRPHDEEQGPLLHHHTRRNH